jgi:DNA-binding transcriptional MerR regulator
MINKVKSIFSIKDLENLSGIKAHTIRIWEKRYNILQPMRTDTNIRLYDLSGLQKLLNISLLHNHGYKISKIASYPEEKIPLLVMEIISDKNANNHAVTALKIAMMKFDQELFSTTYNWLITEKTFKQVFYEVFVPFLDELGLLWQTDTISPAHEHFVTNLIMQKLVFNIEQLQEAKPTKLDKFFVLSLPINEIHELGLMYLYYEILSQGYKVVYLGGNMPLEYLKEVKKHFDSIVFVSYFTVQPERNLVDDYVSQMEAELLGDNTHLLFLGRMAEFIKKENHTDQVIVFNSILELVDSL